MGKYEYGAGSSKYEVSAGNKLTAYAVMVLHYGERSCHLVAIYSPEESKRDSWLSLDGKVSKRIDEVFGGDDSFDKYLKDNMQEISESYKTIKQLV